MKQRIIGLLCVASMLFGCSEQQLSDNIPTLFPEGIQQIQDFETLVDQDVYPINLLSDAAIDRFKTEAIFEDGQLISTYYLDVEKELTKEQWDIFWYTLSGTDVQFLDEDSILKDTNSEIESRRRCLWVYRKNMYFRPGLNDCRKAIGYTCRKCIPCSES